MLGHFLRCEEEAEIFVALFQFDNFLIFKTPIILRTIIFASTKQSLLTSINYMISRLILCAVLASEVVI